MSQVAVKVDSMESQGCEQQVRPSPVHLPPPSPSGRSPLSSSPSSLPPPSSPSPLSLLSCSPSDFPFPPPSPSPLPPVLCSPLSLPPLQSSPSLLLPPPPSPRLPLRPASLRRPRPTSAASFCDPADEEVYHITNSARNRQSCEEAGQDSRGEADRSHSLSPYTSSCPYYPSSPPAPVLLPSTSRSALSLLGAGLKDRDFRKGFRVDTQGFPDKPSLLSAGYPDDQRRHSIEVCLPQAVISSDDQHFTREVLRPERSAQAFPTRVQSVGGHRKKKTSPPCISIHPPSEREHTQIASPPKLADCSMMLRRRSPSYDLTAHIQSNMHTQDIFADTQIYSPMPRALTPIHIPLQTHSPTHMLTPSRVSTPTHTLTYTPPHPSTPTHPHIPISPNIFIQPHASLVPTAMPFSQTRALSPDSRHSSLTGDYIPQFTFDQPQSRYLSDADTATCSSPFDNRLGGGAGFSAKNRRTAQ